MKMRVGLFVLCVGGLAVVLPNDGSAQAADVRPTSDAEIAAQIGRVRTVGDERAVDVSGEWADFKKDNEKLVGSVVKKAVSFDQALARAKALAKKAVNANAVKAARAKVPNASDVVAYRALAIREAMAGNPDGAFCYLVFAHEADPPNADVLSDLAGALAMLGYANEALAILDELQRRRAVLSPPLGLRSEDVMEYTRGYTLLRLGDHAAARKLLEAVKDREPFLSEAPKLLALLDDKEGKNPRKNFILGVWRSRAPVSFCAGVDSAKPEPDPFVEDAARERDEVAIDLRSWLNLSKGKPGVLPNVPFAANAGQANDLIKKLDAAQRAESAAFAVIRDKRAKLDPRKYVHSDSDVEETWGHRMDTILRALDYRDAKLRRLDERMMQLKQEADAKLAVAYRESWDKATEARNKVLLERARANLPPLTEREIGAIMRPFHDAALGRTHGVMVQQDAAIRARFREWHLLATALAGEVGDPKWREFIALTIEAERSAAFSRLLACASAHAGVGQNSSVDAEETGGAGAKEEQGMGECDGNQSVGASTNSLGFGDESPIDVGLEVTCEGLSLEVSVEVLPKLQLSGEIGADKHGGYSVFVGPKIDATVAGTGSTWKSGFGVSGVRGQGVTDFTAKMETKVVASVAGVSRATKINDQSFSFLPSPKAGPPSDLMPIDVK
jgi:tetratricopeptide (TPR) repeat protein